MEKYTHISFVISRAMRYLQNYVRCYRPCTLFKVEVNTTFLLYNLVNKRLVHIDTDCNIILKYV